MNSSTASQKPNNNRAVLVCPPRLGRIEPEDIYSRQDRIPGFRRDTLALAKIVLVGAGGLHAVVAQALLRSGATDVAIVDPDFVDASNLPRQLFGLEDLGRNKAMSLMQHLVSHAFAGARLTAWDLPIEEVLPQLGPVDLILCGVDNHPARFACAREGRRRGIPVVISMLSADGCYGQVFLQGHRSDDACLMCAIPHADPNETAPCAAGVITAGLAAGALIVNFAHRIFMGWPANVSPSNWREFDLLGRYPDATGFVQRRSDCPLCNDTTSAPMDSATS